MRHSLFLPSLVFITLSTGACSMFSKPDTPAAPSAENSTSAPLVTGEPRIASFDPGGPANTVVPLPKEGENSLVDTGPTIVLKKEDKTGVETKDVKPAKVATEKTSGPSPDVSLRFLRNGNLRFQKSYVRKDGQAKVDVQRVAKGQKPHAIIISCSDSRVPPEIVFDQKLGEVFVVRTAGQTLSREVVASVEYGVEHLGARLIMVLGHTQCGAVHATAEAIKGHEHPDVKGALDDSENIAALVKNLRPRIEETVRSQPSKNLQTEGWANVRGAARELFQLSPYLQEALRTGQIKVIGALYELETGAVDFK